MEKPDFRYKVCIPYHDHAMGGMYTFLSYFKHYLRENNVAFTRNMFSRYDILFINSFMTPYYKIRIAKMLHPDVFIVHRIDGSALDYGRGVEWDDIQKKINRTVDLTIFQSNYGKHATREKYKVIGQDGPVIYNPVDINMFQPCQKSISSSVKPRIAYISFSTNPNKGADEVFRVAKENSDLQFVLIGRFNNRPDLNNITFTEHLSHRDVAKTLRACHFFLFLSQNETCSNVVLEAMASGLPVLYLDSGGTTELVGDTGIAITTETFRDAFEKIWRNWQDWSKATRARAENTFSINKIIPHYLKAISDLKGQE